MEWTGEILCTGLEMGRLISSFAGHEGTRRAKYVLSVSGKDVCVEVVVERRK